MFETEFKGTLAIKVDGDIKRYVKFTMEGDIPLEVCGRVAATFAIRALSGKPPFDVEIISIDEMTRTHKDRNHHD